MKDQIQILKIVFDFLGHLSEEQLEMLVSKKVKLRLEETEKEIDKKEPEIQTHIEEICNKIEEFSTREEVKEYITNLHLIKKELKTIAKKYNIPLGSNETNEQIIEKIIENIVGSKLRFDALLNTDLKNKF